MPEMRREPKSFSQSSSSFLALQLRLFSFIQLGTGVAFIAIACVLIFPPSQSGLAVCFWAVGILAILAGIIGFIAAHEKSIACCLSPYITLSGLVLAAKAGLLLYLFISPTKAVNSVVDAWNKNHENDTTPPSPPVDKIHSGIYIGRWVLLGLFVLQILAIFIALLLRCCAKRAAEKQSNKYQPFVEDLESCYNARTAEANAKLAQMKADLVTTQSLKKSKAGAAYTTEMVPSAASHQSNSTTTDTIAPYRPSTSTAAPVRNTSLPPRSHDPSRTYYLPTAGRARAGLPTVGSYKYNSTGAAAGQQPSQHQRSPLGPSSSSLPASAPSTSVQQSNTITTRDSFKPTWASKAAGNS